jgi:Mrp family chromosome partitioning ATPase
MKRTEFLLLTTQSKIVFETVKKVTKILKELRAQIIGVIENMRLTRRAIFKKEIEKLNIPYLGTINFDQKLESTIGEVDKLSKTCFAQELRTILLNYLVM